MPFFADLARLEAEGRAFVLATVTGTRGSTPQKPGARLVLCDDGTLVGTIGGGAIEAQVLDAARALLADPVTETRVLETHLTHDLGMCCGGAMTVFLEKHGAPACLTVFGAGHVAKELAHLAARVGFSVTVVDARSELVTAERFADARRVCTPPDDFARSLPGGPHAYACVVTHDHPLDQACLEALLPKDFAYLGVIGSQRKAERFRQRLLAQGTPPERLATVEMPMGVDIAALTPAEIALSVVARLVERRRRPGLRAG